MRRALSCPCARMEYERDSHPRLSPVISGRLGYLYRTSALYHKPSQSVFNGGRLIPGSGFPKDSLSDGPRDFSGFFLHWRRLLRQRQNSCVLRSYVCNAPCLPDWRFRLRPLHYCFELAFPQGIPSGLATVSTCPGDLKSPLAPGCRRC